MGFFVQLLYDNLLFLTGARNKSGIKALQKNIHPLIKEALHKYSYLKPRLYTLKVLKDMAWGFQKSYYSLP